MEISGINSDLTSFVSSSQSSEVEQESFQSILENAVNSEDNEEIKEACQQYEAYYLNQLFDEMRKTIPESNLLEESTGSETYEDMLYETIAEEISTGRGVGIADMMYKQLSKE